VLKVQRGDNSIEQKLAPPYLTVGEHRIPLDILAFVIGLVLIFLSQPIAGYAQAKPTDVTTVGEVLLALGALFFIFGRIEFKK
jgi:hypothetical protein